MGVFHLLRNSRRLSLSKAKAVERGSRCDFDKPVLAAQSPLLLKQMKHTQLKFVNDLKQKKVCLLNEDRPF